MLAIVGSATNILESASYEILILFSTINLFYLAESSGILNSLWQASQRGVAIKMLMR
jgi:NADH:ubiquinone oxidoreductase subunit H